MAGMRIKKSEDVETPVFTLTGAIDDLADFSLLTREKSAKNLVLDFDQIEEINSYGVKIWSQFLMSMKERTIIYRNCRPPIVRQLNVVINLRRNVRVESFYAPFECTSCLIEREILCEAQSIDPNNPEVFFNQTLSATNCPRCAGHMEFMDDEMSYFRFLLTGNGMVSR